MEDAALEEVCAAAELVAAELLLEEVLVAALEVVSTASKISPRCLVQVGKWLVLYQPMPVEPQALVASKPVEVQ